jgi:hypothetical protein
MKVGIFMLTRNEQRVVIVLLMAVLVAAFIRYWRTVNMNPKPNHPDNVSATATPFPSPDEDGESQQE